MKKTFTLLTWMAIIAPFILLTSCGKNGADGLVFLEIYGTSNNSCYDAISFSTSDAAVPNNTFGLSYETSPGTYSFSYYLSNSCGGYDESWTGYYTLDYNAGEAGGLISNGRNGADRYYSFYCDEGGHTMTYVNGRMTNQNANLTPGSVIKVDTVYVRNGLRMKVVATGTVLSTSGGHK